MKVQGMHLDMHMINECYDRNRRGWFKCCLNRSSESLSTTSEGRAFQAGMVLGRNAYLKA